MSIRRNGNWKGILTTNHSLTFKEAYRIYSMRWSTEVFFHEAKGLLGLGQCQCRDFSSQIASISLAILQYNILSTVKRFEDYQTIGGLFNETLSGTLELSVTSKIGEAILDAIAQLAEIVSTDEDELLASLVSNNPKLIRLMCNYANKMAA